jgi:hypothetical protein
VQVVVMLATTDFEAHGQPFVTVESQLPLHSSAACACSPVR